MSNPCQYQSAIAEASSKEKDATVNSPEEMHEKANLCHIAAQDILQPLGSSVDILFSIAPSAHASFSVSQPDRASLLTYDNSDIRKVGSAFALAEHVALYEPGRNHVKQIFGQLKADTCTCYVFSLLDADYGIDSAVVSFAKKFGHTTAYRLKHVTLVGQGVVGKKNWAVYCAIYQPNQPWSRIHLSAALSARLPIPEHALVFSFDIIGTTGVIPETSLNAFIQLGMTVWPIKGETPVKVITTKPQQLQKFRVSWHSQKPMTSQDVREVLEYLRSLVRTANRPGNQGELQVFINCPVVGKHQGLDYDYIDVPWSPKHYSQQQTTVIHETLRSCEIPHSFHKFGLRLYTSCIMFQMANNSLKNNAGIVLRDQQIHDAYKVTFKPQASHDLAPLEVSLQSATADCYTAMQLDLLSHRPEADTCQKILSSISAGFVFKTMTTTKNAQGHIRLVAVFDIPREVSDADLCKVTSASIQGQHFAFTISHLSEVAHVAWRREPISARFENQRSHWRNCRDDRQVPGNRIGALLPPEENDTSAVRRMHTATFGRYMDCTYYHLACGKDTLPSIILQSSSRHKSQLDYMSVIQHVVQSNKLDAEFYEPIIQQGRLEASGPTRAIAGETGFVVMQYTRKTLVNVPHFTGKIGNVTVSETGTLHLQVYNQAVVIVPLPNNGDVFAFLGTPPDSHFTYHLKPIAVTSNQVLDYLPPVLNTASAPLSDNTMQVDAIATSQHDRECKVMLGTKPINAHVPWNEESMQAGGSSNFFADIVRQASRSCANKEKEQDNKGMLDGQLEEVRTPSATDEASTMPGVSNAVEDPYLEIAQGAPYKTCGVRQPIPVLPDPSNTPRSDPLCNPVMQKGTQKVANLRKIYEREDADSSDTHKEQPPPNYAHTDIVSGNPTLDSKPQHTVTHNQLPSHGQSDAIPMPPCPLTEKTGIKGNEQAIQIPASLTNKTLPSQSETGAKTLTGPHCEVTQSIIAAAAHTTIQLEAAKSPSLLDQHGVIQASSVSMHQPLIEDKPTDARIAKANNQTCMNPILKLGQDAMLKSYYCAPYAVYRVISLASFTLQMARSFPQHSRQIALLASSTGKSLDELSHYSLQMHLKEALDCLGGRVRQLLTFQDAYSKAIALLPQSWKELFIVKWHWQCKCIMEPQKGEISIFPLIIEEGTTPFEVFHNFAAIVSTSIFLHLDQATRCGCDKKLGQPPTFCLPEILVSEFPNAFLMPAVDCAAALAEHLNTQYPIDSKYIVAALILYQENPKHYLVLENVRGLYLRLVDSLQGATVFSDMSQLAHKYVVAAVMRRAASKKTYPALALQEHFYDRWGCLPLGTSRRRNVVGCLSYEEEVADTYANEPQEDDSGTTASTREKQAASPVEIATVANPLVAPGQDTSHADGNADGPLRSEVAETACPSLETLHAIPDEESENLYIAAYLDQQFGYGKLPGKTPETCEEADQEELIQDFSDRVKAVELYQLPEGNPGLTSYQPSMQAQGTAQQPKHDDVTTSCSTRIRPIDKLPAGSHCQHASEFTDAALGTPAEALHLRGYQQAIVPVSNSKASDLQEPHKERDTDATGGQRHSLLSQEDQAEEQHNSKELQAVPSASELHARADGGQSHLSPQPQEPSDDQERDGLGSEHRDSNRHTDAALEDGQSDAASSVTLLSELFEDDDIQPATLDVAQDTRTTERLSSDARLQKALEKKLGSRSRSRPSSDAGINTTQGRKAVNQNGQKRRRKSQRSHSKSSPSRPIKQDIQSSLPRHKRNITPKQAPYTGKGSLSLTGNTSIRHYGQECKYLLISLFDGCGFTRKVVEDTLGQKPVAVITAECEPHLRAFVAAKWGYQLNQSWAKDFDGIPSIYLEDVWGILANQAKILCEAVSLLNCNPPEKTLIVVVGGSPCQDLTYAGKSAQLGVVGSRSVHIHVFYALFLVIQKVFPNLYDRILPVIENAGSMMEQHRDYISTMFGIRDNQRHTTQAGDSGHVRRGRLFFTRLTKNIAPKAKERVKPWQKGWVPLLKDAAYPWLRTRGTAQGGSAILTANAYRPQSLLYHYKSFGGKNRLSLLVNESGFPRIEWAQFMPESTTNAWLAYVDLVKRGKNTYDVLDPLVPQFADALAGEKTQGGYPSSLVNPPFRVPNLTEMLSDTGLNSWFADRNSLTEHQVIDAVGNCFVPSILASQLGGMPIKKLLQVLDGAEGCAMWQILPWDAFHKHWYDMLDKVQAQVIARKTASYLLHRISDHPFQLEELQTEQYWNTIFGGTLESLAVNAAENCQARRSNVSTPNPPPLPVPRIPGVQFSDEVYTCRGLPEEVLGKVFNARSDSETYSKYHFSDASPTLLQFPIVLKMACIASGMFPCLFVVETIGDTSGTQHYWMPPTAASTAVLVTLGSSYVQVLYGTVEVSMVSQEHQSPSIAPLHTCSVKQEGILAEANCFLQQNGLQSPGYLAFLLVRCQEVDAALVQVPNGHVTILNSMPVVGVSDTYAANEIQQCPELRFSQGLLSFLSGIWKGKSHNCEDPLILGEPVRRVVDNIIAASRAAAGQHVVYGPAGSCHLYIMHEQPMQPQEQWHLYDGKPVSPTVRTHLPSIHITICAPRGIVTAVHVYHGFPPKFSLQAGAPAHHPT